MDLDKTLEMVLSACEIQSAKSHTNWLAAELMHLFMMLRLLHERYPPSSPVKLKLTACTDCYGRWCMSC